MCIAENLLHRAEALRGLQAFLFLHFFVLHYFTFFHNKDAEAILEIKKSPLTIEFQAIGTTVQFTLPVIEKQPLKYQHAISLALIIQIQFIQYFFFKHLFNLRGLSPI